MEEMWSKVMNTLLFIHKIHLLIIRIMINMQYFYFSSYLVSLLRMAMPVSRWELPLSALRLSLKQPVLKMSWERKDSASVSLPLSYRRGIKFYYSQTYIRINDIICMYIYFCISVWTYNYIYIYLYFFKCSRIIQHGSDRS